MKFYLIKGWLTPEEKELRKAWDRYSRTGHSADRPKIRCPQPSVTITNRRVALEYGVPRRVRL